MQTNSLENLPNILNAVVDRRSVSETPAQSSSMGSKERLTPTPFKTVPRIIESADEKENIMFVPVTPKATIISDAVDNIMKKKESPVKVGKNEESSFQMGLLQTMVEDIMQKYQSEIRADIQNVHLEVLRQFQIQKTEMKELMEAYYPSELIDKIDELELENDRLKKNY